MFLLTTHLRSHYHWRSDLGFFLLGLNQRTGQVLVKWPQPFYREDARRTLEKVGGIHKPKFQHFPCAFADERQTERFYRLVDL